jgi:hypothetical protein
MTRSTFHRLFTSLGLLSVGLAHSKTAQAVPASILLQPTGTQADVQWARLENDRFVIYFDSTQPTLGSHALRAVEKAYPDLSLLLGARLKGQPIPPELKPKNVLTSNFAKIPVIISSRSDGPSFANFVSQSLEIQSSESPPAALFQHELSHRMMYEHIDLNVGPAGRTFMLAMLPSWWTEGLPEYLTESLGRIETNGYLRAMALNNTFLSWDRLHALYKASGDTSVRGYALSGRFFKYFLERTPSRSLRELHSSLTWRQLMPPFFTGSYFLIRSLTGQWPGDLYESFKSDLTKEIIDDLEGMPRLKAIKGAQRVFDNLGSYNFVQNDKTIIQTDFSTDSRKGGLQIFKFNSVQKDRFVKGYLQPLKIQANDRITVHAKDWTSGGFWTTSNVTAANRTTGQRVSYYTFNGPLDQLTDANIKGRIDFPLGGDARPPSVQRIVATGSGNAAVLTTLNTESKLYMLNAKLRQHTLLGQWKAPSTVTVIRPHHSYPENESALCAHVIVNNDEEKTSIQRICHGQAPEIIVPEGRFYIRDAVMLGADDFVLLTGWNNAQALVRWSREKSESKSELIAGLPDWVLSFEPADQRETLMMRVFTGTGIELWQTPLQDLQRAHQTWISSRPDESQWHQPPSYRPYQPPFARYANDIRQSAGLTQQNTSATDSRSNSSLPKATLTNPAPYRLRHWMTYPNALPPFVAGTWTFGFFSRPIVDELERFYLQLFGTYYNDPSIEQSDRLALEANIVGNRVFDGWKANVFMRPRFNGLTGCKFGTDPTVYVCQLSLRETGADLQWNRRILSIDANSDLHSRLYQIQPSSRSAYLSSPAFGAQTALLGNVGGALSFDLWNKVLFDRPVTDLSKRDINLNANLRASIDTTQSLGSAKAGDGTPVSAVSFQNYSVELTHSTSYLTHSMTLRNSYSSTGGGAPLNAREFFRPFKTYIIGANDGLQDISMAIAGNGLLDYNLTGRAQYRNSLSYSFPLISNLDTRFAIAYLEKLDGEIVLSRGGTSNDYLLNKTNSISTITGSLRLGIDIKGYQFNPSILYGYGIDKPLWQLFTQIKFDQFW